MTDKDNTNNLPEYIQNSKEITKQECLDIAMNSKEVLSKEDRYTLHIAQTYFKNNILSFSAEEFSIITANKYFTKNLGNKYAEDILDKCIKHKQSFSTLLSGWFDKKISDGKKTAYLQIINSENNEKQIQEFYTKDERLTESFFRTTLFQSDALINTVLKNVPHYIFDVFSWSDKQVIEWLNNNQDKTLEISNRNKTSKIKSFNIQKKFFDNVLIELEKKQDKCLTSSVFLYSSEDFLLQAKNNHKVFFEEFLNSYLKEDFQSSINQNSIPNIVCNGTQYLLLKRNIESISKINEIFSDYKDLILQNIDEDIDFYTKSTHSLEYCLRTKNFNLFIPFGNGKELKEEEQFMNMAAAFSYINTSKITNKKTSALNDWCDNTLIHGDYSLFRVYLDTFNNRQNIDEDIKKDLQAINLMRDLQLKLPKKEENTKKLKI